MMIKCKICGQEEYVTNGLLGICTPCMGKEASESTFYTIKTSYNANDWHNGVKIC